MKRDYFARLSRAARWYLPPAEAAEVLEDYREITEGRPEEELRRDLGTPRAAVRQLASPRTYRYWLAAFAGMTVCVGMPAVIPLVQELSLWLFVVFRVFWMWEFAADAVRFLDLYFWVGGILAWVWFQRGRRTEPGRRLPRRMLPCLLLVLMGMAVVWFWAWMLLTEQMELIQRLTPTEGRARAMRLWLTVNGFAMGLIGFFGLLKARLGDRRWRAVYILGLTGSVLGLAVWAFLTSMSLPLTSNEMTQLLGRYAVITLAGLLGTAVSLC